MGVLDGKVAIIIGAMMDESGGIGIGGATAQLMAREGAGVVAVDIKGAGAERTLAVNLTGALLGCEHAIPHRPKRGGGARVNTSPGTSLGGDLVRASSDAAAFIPGQLICVDGGFSSHAAHVADFMSLAASRSSKS